MEKQQADSTKIKHSPRVSASIKYLIVLGVAPIISLLDQWTKQLIIEHFELGERLPLIEGFFNITHVRNTGAAFGFLADAHPDFRVPFFYIIPILAVLVLLAFLWRVPSQARLIPFSLGLMVGGAIGNLLDRINRDSVVDFLDFHWQNKAHFPAFNVADIAITVGVVILIIDLFWDIESNLKGAKHAPTSI